MSIQILRMTDAGKASAAIAGLVLLLLLPASGAQASGPDNDDFDSATPVTELPFTDVVITTEATSDPTDPNCFGGARTVWYSIRPTVATRISVDTLESNHDTTVGVYTGTKGLLTEVACNDNVGYSKKSMVRFDAQAATTYLVMVGSLATGPRGTMRLSVTTAAPKAPNDDEPTVVAELPFSETVDVTEATAGPDDPDCYESRNTVWYSYRPTGDIRLEVDTSASNWDTIIGVYEGESLTRVVCTDYPIARFNARAGKTYRVMIGNFYDSFAGDLVVTLAKAPPALEVGARIAGKGRVVRFTGAVRIKIGVQCSANATAYASGAVRQRQGGRIVTARFNRRFKCSARWTDARVTAAPQDRAFKRGKALVKLRVNAYASEEGARTSMRKVVRIR